MLVNSRASRFAGSRQFLTKLDHYKCPSFSMDAQGKDTRARFLAYIGDGHVSKANEFAQPVCFHFLVDVRDRLSNTDRAALRVESWGVLDRDWSVGNKLGRHAHAVGHHLWRIVRQIRKKTAPGGEWSTECFRGLALLGIVECAGGHID